jgi:hypothetical protein
VRDADWLEQQRNLYAKESEQISDRKIIELFKASYERIVGRPGRPMRVKMSSLASAAGLTRIRIVTLVRSHPQLKAFCSESDDRFVKRRVVWAVSELVRSRTLMSASDLLGFAGLRPCKENADLVRAELQRVGLPILKAGGSRARAFAPLDIAIVRPRFSSSGKQVP